MFVGEVAEVVKTFVMLREASRSGQVNRVEHASSPFAPRKERFFRGAKGDYD